MATGGESIPMKDKFGSVSPNKIALMIELINQHSDYKEVTTEEYDKRNQHSDYKVATTEEYDKLNQSTVFKTSTPAYQIKQPLVPPPPLPVHDKEKPSNENTQHTFIINTQAYTTKPRMPIFSGEDKSEVSFEVWKYEVKCKIREGNYSETIFAQYQRFVER